MEIELQDAKGLLKRVEALPESWEITLAVAKLQDAIKYLEMEQERREKLSELDKLSEEK